jgi:uncharacterized protein (TIGR03437 family)
MLMPNKIFKLSIIAFFCAVFIIFGLNGSRVIANQTGPPASRTGAPSELTCATSLCHDNFPLNSGTGTLRITGLPATYTPNQEITVTVTLNQANRALYGFQVTALDDQNRRAGEMSVTEPPRTQRTTGVVGGNLREYISHSFIGTTPNGTNQGSWTFRWKAPAQSVGRVTFYAAGNAANGSGTTAGDFIYTTSASIQPGSAVGPLASVSAASFAATAPLSPQGIVAGFGSGLSVNVVSASSLPLPTQLDGTEVRVRDASGNDRNAGLFFVAPTQINYLIPAGTANGTATITVRRSGNDVAQGTVTIESVAPGLFAANANGQGVAAAVVFRRRGAVDTTEPVAQLNSTTGRFEPVPIDLGPETDLVFLIAFGTGIRGVSAQSAATATIGGTNAPVSFAGATPGFEGLDQANISIPRSLIGRGVVDVVLRVDNKTANTVQINVK